MALKKQDWEDNIDWGRLFRYLLSKWIYFFISVFGAYVIAIVYLNYQSPVYTVSSTILIKTSSSSLEKNLGGLDLSNEDRGLNNQISIIHSFKFIRRTLSELDFGISYHHAGNVRTIELYKDSPFRIELDSDHVQLLEMPIYVTFKSKSRYRIQTLKPSGGAIYNLRAQKTEGYANGVFLDFEGEIGKPYVSEYFAFTLFLTTPEVPAPEEEEPHLYFVLHELDAMAQNYKNGLRIYPETKESSILQLSLSGPVMLKDITFLNKLSEVYIQNSLDEKNRNIINTIFFIDEQLKALAKDLDLSEDERESFQRNIHSLDFHSNAKDASTKLEEFEGKKEDLQLKLKYCTYLKEYIEKNKDSGDLVVPSAIGIEDGILTSLIGNLIEAQAERSSIVSEAGKINPYLIQVEKRILLAKRSILENLKHTILSVQSSINDLEGDMVALEKSIENLPSSERRLMEIERKFNVKDHLYNFLLEKRAEAGITQAANRPDHMVVEDARRLSAVQIGPKTALIKNEAILIGFFIPLIFFTLRNILSDKIMSKEMIARFSDLPILGIVGHTIHKKSQFIVTDFPKSSVTEALRSIRINMTYLAPHVKNKAICITSSVSGEGKSFLSANLATLMAMVGSKVIMIGADMRKPAKFDDLGLKNEKGLSTILSNRATVEECIQKTHLPNLDFILSGPIPPNPSELLSLPDLGDLIKRLSQEYEFVVVDTPPVGLVSDAMLIFEFCDIHLFVVRYHYTSISMLKKLDEIVKSTPVVKNAMVIFNDYVEISKKYYYNRGYGYYDEGFSDEKNPIKRISKSTIQFIKRIRKVILDSLRV
jgi:capsular exopolysaccharide synthesis family protein